MKWSRYNFLIKKTSKGSFLYNSYSNCLLRLDDDLYISLTVLSKNDEMFEKTLSSFSKEEIEYFLQNYILIDDDDVLVEIMHLQSLARLHSKKTLDLTIAPTQSCNFGCTYCFESNRESHGMSDQTEDAIINYIKNQKEKEGLETIHLTWYGGEPLLEYKRVISLAKRIKDLELEINENILITNGYFFTVNIISELVNAGVTSVQITLDGDKSTHDIRRPLLDGKGTFDKIIGNLDSYFNSEYKDSLQIALRVNIDKRNYEHFIQLHNWLNTRYKSNNLFVYPGIIVLDGEDKNSHVCLSRNEVTNMFLELYEKHGLQFEELYPDDINIECMTRSPHSMLIGSSGEIYKCYEELGEKKYIVGNINNKDIWTSYERIAQYATGIDHYNDPICRKCSYLPICRGGCPVRRLENVYMNKKNDCCTPFKGRIEEYLNLYLGV